MPHFHLLAHDQQLPAACVGRPGQQSGAVSAQRAASELREVLLGRSLRDARGATALHERLRAVDAAVDLYNVLLRYCLGCSGC